MARASEDTVVGANGVAILWWPLPRSGGAVAVAAESPRPGHRSGGASGRARASCRSLTNPGHGIADCRQLVRPNAGAPGQTEALRARDRGRHPVLGTGWKSKRFPNTFSKRTVCAASPCSPRSTSSASSPRAPPELWGPFEAVTW